MKRVFLFLLAIVFSIALSAQIRMNAWVQPDLTTNFAMDVPVYTLVWVESNSTLYSIDAPYTTADDVQQAITDGNAIIYMIDPMTTRGDVVIRNAANATARLGIGANTFVLSSDGTDISWAANPLYWETGGAGALLQPIAGIDTIDMESEVVLVDGATFFTDPLGASNVKIGDQTGSTAIGFSNLMFGERAGKDLTSSDANVLMGADAGQNLTSNSDDNVAIGADALEFCLNGDDRNVVIGSGAGGHTSNTSGSNRVLIGSFAGNYETVNNTIIIDNLNRGSAALGRTGAPFYSVTNATPGSTITSIGGGGDVGINDITPTYGLDVNGTFRATGNGTFDSELTSDNSFAEMYNPTTVISTASSSTYYALLGWTSGLSRNAATDVVDSMMIIDQAGFYKGDFSMSFTHSGTAVLVHISPFVRDGAGAWTEITKGETQETKATAANYSNIAGTFLVQLSAGDTLGLRVMSDKTGNLTIDHGNFNVTRIP